MMNQAVERNKDSCLSELGKEINKDVLLSQQKILQTLNPKPFQQFYL